MPKRTESVTPGLLIVAATGPELCGRPGLVCGVGPVEAAAATARALALSTPAAILHVGIAGGRGLAPGTLVLGSEAVYCDLGAAIPLVTRVAPDADLLGAARSALPAARLLPIGTSAAVSTPRDTVSQAVSVEAMEGFAVLRAAALAGVPALEVRAVSNELGEQDRSRWHVAEALAALDAALRGLLPALAG